MEGCTSKIVPAAAAAAVTVVHAHTLNDDNVLLQHYALVHYTVAPQLLCHASKKLENQIKQQ